MCPNPQFPGNLVIFTEKILNGKPHDFCALCLDFVNLILQKCSFQNTAKMEKVVTPHAFLELF